MIAYIFNETWSCPVGSLLFHSIPFFLDLGVWLLVRDLDMGILTFFRFFNPLLTNLFETCNNDTPSIPLVWQFMKKKSVR